MDRKEYCREYYKKNKKHLSEYQKKWQRGNSEYQKNHLRNLRKSVIEALGAKCMRCGFDDTRALQIDHINGGGSQERKAKGFSGSFHRNVLRSFINKENKYQLLCANCNWIKRVENREFAKK